MNLMSIHQEPDIDLPVSKRKKGPPCKALLYKNGRKKIKHLRLRITATQNQVLTVNVMKLIVHVR